MGNQVYNHMNTVSFTIVISDPPLQANTSSLCPSAQELGGSNPGVGIGVAIFVLVLVIVVAAAIIIGALLYYGYRRPSSKVGLLMQKVCLCTYVVYLGGDQHTLFNGMVGSRN